MSYRGKCILLGDPAVGKTSLLSRYAEGKFPESYNPTIGANFLIKEVDLKDIIDNLSIKDKDFKENIKEKGLKIYFWDICGQHDKIIATEYYFQDALGAIVVFDLANEVSFQNIEFWISKLQDLSGDVPFIIVGNKTDLTDDREISEDLIKKLADKYDCEYFETSAKLNENVRKAFETLSSKILSRLD